MAAEAARRRAVAAEADSVREFHAIKKAVTACLRYEFDCQLVSVDMLCRQIRRLRCTPLQLRRFFLEHCPRVEEHRFVMEMRGDELFVRAQPASRVLRVAGDGPSWKRSRREASWSSAAAAPAEGPPGVSRMAASEVAAAAAQVELAACRAALAERDAELARLQTASEVAAAAAEVTAAQAQRQEAMLLAIRELFMCPIQLTAWRDPVVAADGHTYERHCITRCLAERGRSPMTNVAMQHQTLIENRLAMQIQQVLQRHGAPYALFCD